MKPLENLASEAPALDVDPFTHEYIIDPYPFHRQMRDAGPVVWLERYGIWSVSRYAQVKAVLHDPSTFCSGLGVGLSNFKDDEPWRPPSLLLETDPPRHTTNRAIISRILSPATLKRLRNRFEVEAIRLVEQLLERESFDAIPDLAEAYPLKVFADAIGIRPDGRTKLIAYGNMVFNGMGPKNDLYRRAMENASTVSEWVWNACQREALSPDGLGREIFEAVDNNLLTETEGAMLVRSFMSAGIDTTANAIGSALYCLAQHPQEWDKLRGDPSLARATVEETLRFESPFQTFFRTTTCATSIEGIAIGSNEKVMISLGSANRDPAQWSEPDEFNITRSTIGHVGFGAGIHACVGQMMARLEVEMILRALAAKVASIELAGAPRLHLHNTLRGYAALPLRLKAA